MFTKLSPCEGLHVYSLNTNLYYFLPRYNEHSGAYGEQREGWQDSLVIVNCRLIDCIRQRPLGGNARGQNFCKGQGNAAGKGCPLLLIIPVVLICLSFEYHHLNQNCLFSKIRHIGSGGALVLALPLLSVARAA